jgi:hypothetical protein
MYPIQGRTNKLISINAVYVTYGMELKGQSHEKVGELRVWGGSQGPN